MQPSIGQVLRQIRQLRHLTQRDLAGDRFSKSYVSAIEHDRLVPSSSALRFFAQRLGQPNGDFVALLQQPEVVNALSVPDILPPLLSNGKVNQEESAALLERLLEARAFPHLFAGGTLATLTPEQLTELPQHVQAHYSVLLGKEARAQRDLAAALHAFETALQFVPAEQQAAILDDIGHTYFLRHAPFTALGYHLHARHLLSKASLKRSSAALFLQIELHCGDTYRALGAYREALEHYERARSHLNTHHDLATAGHLYAKLGYCTYAALFPAFLSSASSALPPDVTRERIEREAQQALGLLLQSRSVYQVSGDHLQESNVGLMLTSLLLDWCTWRRRQINERVSDLEKQTILTDCASLLNNAAEHNQSILLRWQHAQTQEEPLVTELDAVLFTTLASLIRIAVGRALLARLGGSALDVAYRQRAFAAFLCQRVLDTLSVPTLPWAIVEQVAVHSAETLEYAAPTLPRLPDLPLQPGAPSLHSPLSRIEIYAAAGEVAEELGRAAPVLAYARDCYAQSTRFFQAALSLARSLPPQDTHDPGYQARLSQRWVALLEERARTSPALSEATTKVLLDMLAQSFWHLQRLPGELHQAAHKHEEAH